MCLSFAFFPWEAPCSRWLGLRQRDRLRDRARVSARTVALGQSASYVVLLELRTKEDSGGKGSFCIACG